MEFFFFSFPMYFPNIVPWHFISQRFSPKMQLQYTLIRLLITYRAVLPSRLCNVAKCDDP
jgi:hypothetical protein